MPPPETASTRDEPGARKAPAGGAGGGEGGEAPAGSELPLGRWSRPPGRLRRWLVDKVDTPLALPAMCTLSFADACVSPIIPEVLLVPMILAEPRKKWLFTFWCSLASVLGGMVGYWLGYSLWEAGLRELAFEYVPGFTPALFEEISHKYGEHAFLWVFLAGFTPLPYKVFTVAAGVCHADVDFAVFTAAAALSRFLRFYVEVLLLDRFGPPLIEWVARRIWLSMALLLAVIAWFVFG